MDVVAHVQVFRVACEGLLVQTTALPRYLDNIGNCCNCMQGLAPKPVEHKATQVTSSEVELVHSGDEWVQPRGAKQTGKIPEYVIFAATPNDWG